MHFTRIYLPKVIFVALVSIQYASSLNIDGICDDDTKECVASNRRLTPADLPLPNVFKDFGANTSVAISDVEVAVMPGSILQQGKHVADNLKNKDLSDLVVLPGLLPRSVVAEMLTLLRGHEDADQANGRTTIVLDDDPDSVDGMTSQEIFLDNDSLRQGQPSKGNPNENMNERRELRAKLRALTDKYSYGILTPFLEKWYGKEKCGKDGRHCTPCYSLIRRYRAGERQSHAPHNDGHSFVTVVVSLTDYGREFTGGLYVSTKNSERNYVKLNRGDAVVHQGGERNRNLSSCSRSYPRCNFSRGR